MATLKILTTMSSGVSSFISRFRAKPDPPSTPSTASSPHCDLCLEGPEIELLFEISRVDKEDSDEIYFASDSNGVNFLDHKEADQQGSDPPDHQHCLGLGQYPVNCDSGASIPSQQSYLFMRPDTSGPNDGNISDNV